MNILHLLHVAVLLLPAALPGVGAAIVPKHFSQVVRAAWGQVPTEPCVSQARTLQITFDASEMDSYTYAAEVQNRVVEACRGSVMETDCRSASWATTPGRGPGWLDVSLCGHPRNRTRASESTRATHGVVDLCHNDGQVRILCRPSAFDATARAMRAATFDTPYETLCDPDATVCACDAAAGPHVYLDDTCNPLPCPAGCSGHGHCNTATTACQCEAGYYGHDCSAICSRVSPANGEVCSGHGVCGDPGAAGPCECAEGYAGDLCGECAPGFYGPGDDCSAECPLSAAEPVCAGPYQGTRACGMCGGSYSYTWWDEVAQESVWHEDEERGHCDPYVGCVCRPGSLLDPRTACSTCLPGTVWRRNTQGLGFQMQCVARGLCRTSKAAASGLDPDANPHCRVEDFQYTTQWCAATEGSQDVAEPCSPRADVPPCNGHGTCVSHLSVGADQSVRAPQLPTLAVFDGVCIVALDEAGNVVMAPWPGDPQATCGANEGVRAAGHFTGDPEDKFTHLLRSWSHVLAATASGEVWTIDHYWADITPWRWDIDYAAHAAAGDRLVAVFRSGAAFMALVGRTVYYAGDGPVAVAATLPVHMEPTGVVGSSLYAAVSTRSGDWWYFYSYAAPWTSDYCCIFDSQNANLLPVATFGSGVRAVYVTFDNHQPYALTTGGLMLKWDSQASEWAALLTISGTRRASLFGPDYARVTWTSADAGTKVATLATRGSYAIPSNRTVVEFSVDGSGILRDDGVVVAWVGSSDETPVAYDMEASTGRKPMGALSMPSRFYTIASGMAEDATVRESDVLGSLLVVDNTGQDLVGAQTCMCDKGWAGSFCTVQTDCPDPAATGASCTSGLFPGPTANPVLDLLLSAPSADPAAAGEAGEATHVRPIGAAPSLQSRTESTRVHVLRQREVELDTSAVFLRVSGVTHVEARRYTPARAEYLCYRAHREGRILAEEDLHTLRPADLQALARELDYPTSEPAPADGLFWVRGAAAEGGWAYTAADKTMAAVRTYDDTEPTVVANVVCAFDHDALLASPPGVDSYHRCKLPAWFCALWTGSSSLAYCGWMGVA